MSKVYVHTDASGRIIAINSDAFLPDLTDWMQVDDGEGDRYRHAQGNYLPDGLTTEQGNYRYKLADGQLTERTSEEIQADIDAMPPPEPTAQERTEKAAKVMFRALAKTDVISQQDALANQQMFERWIDRIDTQVTSGEYLQYEDGLYRVQQTHTVLEIYPPSTATAALYTRINHPDVIPEWTQGSWDAGVKVRHNGKIWESMVPNNVWEPGSIGVGENIWKEVAA